MASISLPRLAGATLGGVFGAVALVRRSKPLHPKGLVLDATIRRTGTRRRWGSAWLDEPGEDRGLARLSQAVGLPTTAPDILGLALTFGGADGPRHDLLLATTGLAPIARFVLVPRRDPVNSAYTSLFPYRAPHGAVMLAAVPADRHPAVAMADLRSVVALWPLSFRLLAAAPAGGWRQFGSLELTAREGGEADPPLTFDPVLHPLPGLTWHRSLAELREPAYAVARRVRGSAATGPTAQLASGSVVAVPGQPTDHGSPTETRSERGQT